MKRLAAAFIFMAIVNVANAGIVDLQISSINGQPINPTNEITFFPSDVIGVDVVYIPDPGMTIGSISKEMVISPSSGMTASISTITWAPGWDMDLSRVTILPNGDPLIDTVANNFGSVAPGIVLDHFLLHCENIFGAATVTLVENPNTNGMESFELDAALNLHHLGEGYGILLINPEPMTLTLLGLGSLFLARRKK